MTPDDDPTREAPGSDDEHAAGDRGPSDDATADIEERQGDGHSEGRPPEDAPAY